LQYCGKELQGPVEIGRAAISRGMHHHRATSRQFFRMSSERRGEVRRGGNAARVFRSPARGEESDSPTGTKSNERWIACRPGFFLPERVPVPKTIRDPFTIQFTHMPRGKIAHVAPTFHPSTPEPAAKSP
jgi:hypothetical protein